MDRIETERLYLRRFLHFDWKDLYEYLSDEAVVRYEPYEVFTPEECKYEAASRSKKDDFWAVCLKDNDKLIGNIYFEKVAGKERLTRPRFGRRMSSGGQKILFVTVNNRLPSDLPLIRCFFKIGILRIKVIKNNILK
jgi:hypothetical protein